MAVFSPGVGALVFLFGLPSLWAPGPRAVKDGNAAYRKGDYVRAASAYRKAREVLPGDRVAAYNEGTALLGQKKPEEALRSLLIGAADPKREVRSRSLYNSGNALAGGEKHPEALSAYRQAILADPGDLDAKFNYELTRRKLQQQQGQDQNQPDQNKDNQEKDKNKDSPSDQQPQDREQQDQQQNQEPREENQPNADQNPEELEPEPGQEEQGSEQPKPLPATMLSREEAERLLEALKDNEVEMIKARLKSKRKKSVEKDW